MDYVKKFLNVEPALYTWRKSHLVLLHNSFYAFPRPTCRYFVRNSYIYVHERYWFVVFLYYSVFAWIWYQRKPGLMEWIRKCSFCFHYLEAIVENPYHFCLPHLVQFASETVWVWCFLFGQLFLIQFFKSIRADSDDLFFLPSFKNSIASLMTSLAYLLFRSLLFHFQISLNVPATLVLLIHILILLRPESLLDTSVLLNLLRCISWPRMWSVVVHVPCELEKKREFSRSWMKYSINVS